MKDDSPLQGCHIFRANSEGRKTIRFRMGHDTSSNIFPDENSGVRCQYSSRIKYVLLDAKEVGNSAILCLTTRSGRYLEIFHLREGESTVLLRTNWEMLLTHSHVDNLWSIS